MCRAKSNVAVGLTSTDTRVTLFLPTRMLSTTIKSMLFLRFRLNILRLVLASCASRAGRMPRCRSGFRCRRLGYGGKETGEVALLEGADAVSERGGAVEFEFLCRFAPLDFELRENLAQLRLA